MLSIFVTASLAFVVVLQAIAHENPTKLGYKALVVFFMTVGIMLSFYSSLEHGLISIPLFIGTAFGTTRALRSRLFDWA